MVSAVTLVLTISFTFSLLLSGSFPSGDGVLATLYRPRQTSSPIASRSRNVIQVLPLSSTEQSEHDAVVQDLSCSELRGGARGSARHAFDNTKYNPTAVDNI